MLVWAVLVLAAALVVLASVPLTGGRREEVSETELHQIADRADLPLPRRLRRPVLARLDERGTAAKRWGLVGVASGAVLALVLRAAVGYPDLMPLAIMIGAAVGLALGIFRAEAAPTAPLDPAAAEVPQTRRGRMRDVASAGELLAGRAVPLVVLGALAVALLVRSRLPVPAPGGIAELSILLAGGALALAAWGVAVLAASAVAARPRRADDDLTLAWEDTLRGQNVRDVLDAAVGVGLLAILGLLLPCAFWVLDARVRAADPGLALVLGLTALGAAALGGLVLLIPWALGRMRGNPAARLWGGRTFDESGGLEGDE